MSAIDDRLAELSIELPDPPAPLGNYVGAHTVGNLVYLSGHGTNRPDGLSSLVRCRRYVLRKRPIRRHAWWD